MISLFAYMGTQAQGIKFEHGQLQDALNKAKAENKLVFVDVYTKWCGPCKQMVKNIFPLKEVGEFYNKNFISYKLDAENTDIKGPEISEKYKVQGYPTYLFLDHTGKLVYTTSGAMPAEMFIKVGRKALGEDVGGGFAQILEKYENGDRSTDVLYQFMANAGEFTTTSDNKEMKERVNKLFMEVAQLYFKSSPEIYLQKKHFKLLKEKYQYFNINREHAIVKYILDHYDEAKVTIAEEELGYFLMHVNYSSIREEASKGNKAKYQQYIKDINGVLKRAYAFNDESKIQAIPFLTAFGNAEYACGTKDYDTYLVEYEKYLSHLSDLGAIEYLMPARRMIDRGQGTPTKEQLKKCLPFNQIAYDKYKNAYVCTDFGLLMAKLGEKEKAKAYYEEAFQIFSDQGERGKSAIARFKKEMSELGL